MSLKLYNKVLKQNEGGRADGISSSYRPRVMLRNSSVEATLDFPPLKEQVKPGDYVEVGFDLERPLAAEMGVRYVDPCSLDLILTVLFIRQIHTS